ncbi:hypothetical protein ACIBCT_16365 [Streptosporangium sp. NPDC050855]|uniref:hypothetical protein n=1 Tax=Streptosporangium sp. NPDC050855 TaxID=3366194 RepID=UPI00379C295B
MLINETCDISPWAARKIVIWSVRLRYGKSQRAEIRAEEHVALINDRPGKLFKLIMSPGFAYGAVSVQARRLARRMIFHLIIGFSEAAKKSDSLKDLASEARQSAAETAVEQFAPSEVRPPMTGSRISYPAYTPEETREAVEGARERQDRDDAPASRAGGAR